MESVESSSPNIRIPVDNYPGYNLNFLLENVFIIHNDQIMVLNVFKKILKTL